MVHRSAGLSHYDKAPLLERKAKITRQFGMGSTKLDCTEIDRETQGTPLSIAISFHHPHYPPYLISLVNNSKTTTEKYEFGVDE
jgi:hypothetical protein